MSNRWEPIMDDERDVRILPTSRSKEKSVRYVERDEPDPYINNPERRFTILPSRSPPPPSTQRYEQYPSRNEHVYYRDPLADRFDQDLRPHEIHIASTYNPRHSAVPYGPDAPSYRYYDDRPSQRGLSSDARPLPYRRPPRRPSRRSEIGSDSNSDGDTENSESARRPSARRECRSILGHDDENDDRRRDMNRAAASTFSSAPTAVSSGIATNDRQNELGKSEEGLSKDSGILCSGSTHIEIHCSSGMHSELSASLESFEAWIIIYEIDHPDNIKRKSSLKSPSEQGTPKPSKEMWLIQQHISQETIADSVKSLDTRKPVLEKLPHQYPEQLKRIENLIAQKNSSEPDHRFEWLIAQINESAVDMFQESDANTKRPRISTLIYLKRTPKPHINRTELNRRLTLEKLMQAENGYQPKQQQPQQNQCRLPKPQDLIETRGPLTKTNITQAQEPTNTDTPNPAIVDNTASSTESPAGKSKLSFEPTKAPKFILHVTKKETPSYKAPFVKSEADDYEAWITEPEEPQEPANSRKPGPLLLTRNNMLASGTDAQTAQDATQLRKRSHPGINLESSEDVIHEKNTSIGAVAPTVGPQSRKNRSRSRGKRIRLDSKIRTGAEPAGAALSTAAATSLYERRSAKTKAEMGIGSAPVTTRSRGRSRELSSSWGRSRSRSRSKVEHAITGAAAATAAAVGFKKYRDHRRKCDAKMDTSGRLHDRRSSSSPDHCYDRRDGYSSASYSPSQPRASDGTRYPVPGDVDDMLHRQITTPITHNGGLYHGPSRTPGRRQGVRHCSTSHNITHPTSDRQDDEPPDNIGNTTGHTRRRKTLGYSLSLSLILFVLVGIFAACVQSIAVYRLHASVASSHQATWDDIDLFGLLSNSCWLALGLLFSLLLTLKHGSEHDGVGLYVTSTALSQGFAGAGNALQVLVYFLTIRIFEKTESGNRLGVYERRRDELDDQLHLYEKKCRQRREELCDEILHLEERRRAILKAKADEEVRSRLVRQRFRDEALGTSLAGSRSQEEDGSSEKAVSACV